MCEHMDMYLYMCTCVCVSMEMHTCMYVVCVDRYVSDCLYMYVYIYAHFYSIIELMDVLIIYLIRTALYLTFIHSYLHFRSL